MHFASSLLALAAAVSTVSALGINCRGSGICTSDKKGAIDTIIAQLRSGDPNERYSDGQQIVCQEAQICAFYQNTGRTWTRGQTRDFVQGLINHGCAACGSIPVDPGNDVANGQLTINWVSELQGRSLTQNKSQTTKREADTEPAESLIESKAPTSQPPAIRAARNMRFTPRDTPKTQLAKRLGINCRGSGTCAIAAAQFPIASLRAIRDNIANGGDGIWYNGEHVTCEPHQSGRICAFYQNIGSRSFNKGQSLGYIDRLLDHGCKVCGSCPTDDGNDVANGQLTVNYVA